MFNVQSIATASLSQVKEFCKLQGITPSGDKRLLATWRDAAIEWFNAAVEVATSEPVKEAVEAVKEASVTAVKKVWSIVSSEQARHLYFMALVYTCVALLLAWRLVVKGAQHVWSKRDRVPQLTVVEARVRVWKRRIVEWVEYWLQRVEEVEKVFSDRAVASIGVAWPKRLG